ncbi:hypothetical protein [Georgenia sp. SYP-B2076]|uniref:hypothetical protein n=1 Tax=Georgenia sp. SYP-B2076 TaxID=2495881 RepID=UPI001F0C0AC1|nr:hypothetical protein [Georgenia sp. SYP-B2076]
MTDETRATPAAPGTAPSPTVEAGRPPRGAGSADTADDAEGVLAHAATGEAAGDTAPEVTGAPPRRPRRLVVALVVVLVAALAGGTYLGVLARSWSVRAGALEATATDLGTRLARAEADLDQRTSELGTATAQLDTAQARIIELADEKARTGDDREVQRQLATSQERVSEAAASVASSLQSCVAGQDTLIGYLHEADLYDPAELARFEGEVATLCDQAAAANDRLQRELDR